MEAINYLTDASGHRKAIVIDYDAFKRSGKTGRDVVNKLLEDIEDLLDVEAVRNEEIIAWEEVKAQLKNEGLLDE